MRSASSRDHAADGEVRRLEGDLSNGKDSPWTSTEKRVQIASCLVVACVASGTYVGFNLLAAFEQDKALQWTPHSTSRLTTVAAIAEVIGLLTFGTLVDYTSIRQVLMGLSIVLCVGMANICVAGTVFRITGTTCIVIATKGVLWPSYGAMVAANISPTKLDQSFMLAAASARIGSLAMSLTLGGLMMMQWSWRQALASMTGLEALLLLGAWYIMPTNLSPAADRDPSAISVLSKWSTLAMCLDGWLAFVTTLGSYACWTLGSYLVVLAQDAYNLGAAYATVLEATYLFGCILGLVTGSIVSACVSLRAGRMAQLLQVLIAVVALFLLASVQMPLVHACLLWVVVGFGFTIASYIPYMVYAASGPSAHRAFRLATIDALAQFYSIFLASYFGAVRERMGVRAFSTLHLVAGTSLAIASASMTMLYLRLDSRAQIPDSETIYRSV